MALSAHQHNYNAVIKHVALAFEKKAPIKFVSPKVAAIINYHISDSMVEHPRSRVWWTIDNILEDLKERNWSDKDIATWLKSLLPTECKELVLYKGETQ